MLVEMCIHQLHVGRGPFLAAAWQMIWEGPAVCAQISASTGLLLSGICECAARKQSGICHASV